MTRKKGDPIEIQKEMERRILYGLNMEWDQIWRGLPHSWKQAMQKPSFSLRDSKIRLGSWSGRRNEISMSRDFVTSHPWDSVCDVLRHEIAHQAAIQALGAWSEPPHGPSFWKACQILRTDPGASGQYVPLHERMDENNLTEDDKILMRVKKLLALAESGNQHEAEAAMLKAHELIEKYNIDLMADRRKRNYISIFLGKPALRHMREEYSMDLLLSRYYFVFGIWAPAYVVEKTKMGRVLEISGTPQNVKIAAYVYDFVMRFINEEWGRYNKTKKLGRYRKTDFSVGIIEGFKSKLQAQRREKEKIWTSRERSLVLSGDPQMDNYVNYKYPRRNSMRRGGGKQDAGVLNDGIEIGKKLVIHQGINESNGNGGQLLE